MNAARPFTQRFVADLGTALHLATVIVGDRLGLYEAMADGEPVTAAALAERTGTSPCHIAEWLAGQAAAGYVDHVGGTFRLPAEHAALLVDAGGNPPIPSGFQLAASTIKDEPAVTDAFRTGTAVARHDHHTDLFAGAGRLARLRYGGHLVPSWLPALDGVVPALHAGAAVADIGCGRGVTLLIMAAAFPRARFVGYDDHAPSVGWARGAVAQAGLASRVRLEVGAPPTPLPGVPDGGFALVTSFDRLHELADPVAAAAAVRGMLAPGGTWLVVEPYAADRLEDNLTPIGKVFYNASAMTGTAPGALGAQAGEARLRRVVMRAGFTRFRRVGETGWDIAYEVRP